MAIGKLFDHQLSRENLKQKIMSKYYVNRNAQSNGDHEVHKEGCSYMPSSENRIYLGEFSTCSSAVTAAHKHYTQVNGCYYCSRSCHTS